LTSRHIYILFFTVIFLGCNKSIEENLKHSSYFTLTGIMCTCPIFEILKNIQQFQIDKEKGILIVKSFFNRIEKNLFLKEGEYPIIKNEEKKLLI